jgi:hypothetical protein
VGWLIAQPETRVSTASSQDILVKVFIGSAFSIPHSLRLPLRRENPLHGISFFVQRVVSFVFFGYYSSVEFQPGV